MRAGGAMRMVVSSTSVLSRLLGFAVGFAPSLAQAKTTTAIKEMSVDFIEAISLHGASSLPEEN